MSDSAVAVCTQVMMFHGYPLQTWCDAETAVEYVSVRGLCKGIGLGAPAQYARIQGHPTLRKHITYTDILTAGGKQTVLSLDRRHVSTWLMGISPNTVGITVRDTLVLWQEECGEALDAYWSQGVAHNPRFECSEVSVRAENRRGYATVSPLQQLEFIERVATFYAVQDTLTPQRKELLSQAVDRLLAAL